MMLYVFSVLFLSCLTAMAVGQEFTSYVREAGANAQLNLSQRQEAVKTVMLISSWNIVVFLLNLAVSMSMNAIQYVVFVIPLMSWAYVTACFQYFLENLMRNEFSEFERKNMR